MTIEITPQIQRALYAWTADIARARADCEADPIRSCHAVDGDTACVELRDDDAYFCPAHRRAKDKKNRKLRESRRASRAERNAA